MNFVKFLKSTFFIENPLATASLLCHLIQLVRFFQGLKYAYVVHILVFLDLIRFVCFNDLMNRGLFRTLSNIQFELKKLHLLKKFYDRTLNTPLLNIKQTACQCLLYVKVNYMLQIRPYVLPMHLLIFSPYFSVLNIISYFWK